MVVSLNSIRKEFSMAREQILTATTPIETLRRERREAR